MRKAAIICKFKSEKLKKNLKRAEASYFKNSEAVFGRAKEYKRVAGLIRGTDTGGGLAFKGQFLSDGACVVGEFGHSFAPAHLFQKYDLSIVSCGFGKVGCIETLISGPRMTRLSEAMTWRAVMPRDIMQLRDKYGDVAKVWEVWCACGQCINRLALISQTEDPAMKKVQDYIRTIVDFPHEGILFRDVTTLFADAKGFRMAIDQMLHPYAGEQIDKVVGLEARGLILGGAMAYQLGTGFVPIRKKGKLPAATISQKYTLEYGEAVMELHDDAITAGERILLVDDLIATGGTAEAGISLIERLGGEIIGCSFIVDLPNLGGRAKLEKLEMSVRALCAYEGS